MNDRDKDLSALMASAHGGDTIHAIGCAVTAICRLTATVRDLSEQIALKAPQPSAEDRVVVPRQIQRPDEQHRYTIFAVDNESQLVSGYATIDKDRAFPCPGTIRDIIGDEILVVHAHFSPRSAVQEFVGKRIMVTRHWRAALREMQSMHARDRLIECRAQLRAAAPLAETYAVEIPADLLKDTDGG